MADNTSDIVEQLERHIQTADSADDIFLLEAVAREIERLKPWAPEGCTPVPAGCWINNDGWIMRRDGLCIGSLHKGWRERIAT